MDTIENTANKNKQEDNEIEESIIEEEINMAENHQSSPTTPLITSKTKGKGKLNLFKMKPPKPFKQSAAFNEKRDSVHETTIKEEIVNSSQFYQNPVEFEKGTRE